MTVTVHRPTLMWGKIVVGAAGLLVCALAAFLGHQLIAAYGDARQAGGRAEAEAAKLPAIIAANAAAANGAIVARDRLIAANDAHADEMARLLPLILSANDKVIAYAQTDPGRAPCLAADRVHGIEFDRTTLFSASADADAGSAGSMPAHSPTDAIGSQPG